MATTVRDSDGAVQPPAQLRTDEFLLRPIRTSDAELDHEAVVESRAFLRVWEQSDWPEDGFTVEANREDLDGLQRRHAAGESFTYTVLDPTEERCLGCVYAFPTDGRQFATYQVTAVGGDRWSSYRFGVYLWVRTSRVADGLDRRLLEALGPWFRDHWGVEDVLFVTNERLDQQVAMFESVGLQLRFELTKPTEPATSRAYG